MCKSERETIEKNVTSLKSIHTFSLLVFIPDRVPSRLLRLVESVHSQIYPHWELVIIAPSAFQKNPILDKCLQKDDRIRVYSPKDLGTVSSLLPLSVEYARGDYLGFLGSEDCLSESALYEMARELERSPSLKLVYSDEDFVDESGNRCCPVFKPDWSPELFLSKNYLGDLTIYQRKRLLDVSGSENWRPSAARFDVNLGFVRGLDPSQIGHIPKILYHSNLFMKPTGRALAKSHCPAKFQPTVEGLKILQAHLDRNRIPADAEFGAGGSSYRIRYPLPANPKVSIIVPSTCKLHLLKPCIDSLLRRTSSPDFEIFLVVNEVSFAVPEQDEYLHSIGADPRVKVLVYGDQPFNYAKLNNWAVNQTDSPFLCLLNDDTEVVSPGWLSEMVSLAGREGVGAVGAKLHYPNERIQHGGVVLSRKGGFHAFRFFPSDAEGYMGRLHSVCNYSAVTGACLVVRQDLYDKVGGLDEEAFPVAFNDIDFCLKLIGLGYRNVWTPYAELIHKESLTRGLDDTPEKEERFQKEFEIFKGRWEALMEDDPLYNPNLSVISEDFSLTFPPRKRASCLGTNDFSGDAAERIHNNKDSNSGRQE